MHLTCSQSLKYTVPIFWGIPLLKTFIILVHRALIVLIFRGILIKHASYLFTEPLIRGILLDVCIILMQAIVVDPQVWWLSTVYSTAIWMHVHNIHIVNSVDLLTLSTVVLCHVAYTHCTTCIWIWACPIINVYLQYSPSVFARWTITLNCKPGSVLFYSWQ